MTLTHRSFAHQADELMRSRLSGHPEEHFPEWVTGDPSVLRAKKYSVTVFKVTSSTWLLIIMANQFAICTFTLVQDLLLAALPNAAIAFIRSWGYTLESCISA